MAATKTLAQLRAMVRELADQETSAASTAFVDTTELDARINEALKQLYNLLIAARGQEYYVTSTTWAAVADQEDYALPADFMRLLTVYVKDGGSRYETIPTWEMTERPDLLWRGAVGTTNIGEYRYRLQGANISFLPAPSTTSHTFYALYVPAMTELALDTDTFDGVAGWEKWAALTAAIDLASKEEAVEHVQMLMAQRALIQSQIEQLGGERDAGRAPRIQDTRRDNGGYAPWWFEGYI